MTLVAITSIVAAFLFGLSAVLQQRAAARYRDRDNVIAGLSLMRRLVRSRTWLAGQVADLFGFFSQAAALKLGSVGVVQPLITTDLLFALGLQKAGRRQRLTVAEIAGGAAISGGLALFLSVKGATPVDGLPDRQRLFFIAPFVLAAVLAGLLTARRVGPLPAAIVLGTCAGVFFAVSAVLIKLTTYDLIERGVPATATDWPGYLLAVSTVSGLVLEQLAFAAGPLGPGMTAMAITNPLVSYLFAVVAFHSPLPTTPGALAALAGAAALLTAGVLLVSGSAARVLAERTGRSANLPHQNPTGVSGWSEATNPCA